MTTMTIKTINEPVFNEASPLPREAITIFPSPAEGTDDPTVRYEWERRAFASLLPSLIAAHAGKYVAIHGGVVVDSDESHARLVRRFFKAHGDTHVYIGYVGGQAPVARQYTPLGF
jgi:hypothetical protein